MRCRDQYRSLTVSWVSAKGVLAYSTVADSKSVHKMRTISILAVTFALAIFAVACRELRALHPHRCSQASRPRRRWLRGLMLDYPRHPSPNHRRLHRCCRGSPPHRRWLRRSMPDSLQHLNPNLPRHRHCSQASRPRQRWSRRLMPGCCSQRKRSRPRPRKIRVLRRTRRRIGHVEPRINNVEYRANRTSFTRAYRWVQNQCEYEYTDTKAST